LAIRKIIDNPNLLLMPRAEAKSGAELLPSVTSMALLVNPAVP
jgi:hypothetical protein